MKKRNDVTSYFAHTFANTHSNLKKINTPHWINMFMVVVRLETHFYLFRKSSIA